MSCTPCTPFSGPHMFSLWFWVGVSAFLHRLWLSRRNRWPVLCSLMLRSEGLPVAGPNWSLCKEKMEPKLAKGILCSLSLMYVGCLLRIREQKCQISPSDRREKTSRQDRTRHRQQRANGMREWSCERMWKTRVNNVEHPRTEWCATRGHRSRFTTHDRERA